MVSINDEKSFVVVGKSQEELNALREERKRTGRLVASGAAIFIILLGVYQALAGETPQYAALFLPAIIMFTYVGWILYTSKNQRNFLIPITTSDGQELEEVVLDSESVTKSNTNLLQVKAPSPPPPPPPPVSSPTSEELENNRKVEKRKEFQPRTHKTFHRTYSIA